MAFLEKYARDILSDTYYLSLERHPWAILVIYLIHAAIFAAAGLLVGFLIVILQTAPVHKKIFWGMYTPGTSNPPFWAWFG